jgi:transposase
MAFIRGANRGQLELIPRSVDDWISPEAVVRVIEAYVARLDLQALGFVRAKPAATGRPGYDPADLLKLYLYGYTNRIRQSRALEREAERNVELMWLLKQLVPDFKTIADFRRDNAKALLEVAGEFVVFCRGQGLIGGDEVAVDGSKFAAVNARNQVFNAKSLARERERIGQRIARYLAQLDEADAVDDGQQEQISAEAVRKALALLQERGAKLEDAQRQLEQTGAKQVALTDCDSRLMRQANGGYAVSHNAQVAVDGTHKLIVATAVTSQVTDQNQLRPMVEAVKQALDAKRLSVLVDAGYSNGEHAAALAAQNIEVTAPNPNAKNNGFKLLPKSAFSYEQETNRYRCPAGRTLELARDHRSRGVRIYMSANCGGCALKAQCTPGERRHIVRHRYQEALDAMHGRALSDPQRMRKRAAWVEHVIGALKWLMNGGRFLVKGNLMVRAELALAATAYNLKRAISITGTTSLLRALAK